MHKQFYRVARTDDIEPGSGVLVTLGHETDCALFRTEDGRYFATGALCSHQNEPLDHGHLEGCEVVCRRHHLRFDLRTVECTNAGGYAIQIYDVKVEGDEVYVGCWVD